MVRRSSTMSRGTTYWFQFFFVNSVLWMFVGAHASSQLESDMYIIIRMHGNYEFIGQGE